MLKNGTYYPGGRWDFGASLAAGQGGGGTTFDGVALVPSFPWLAHSHDLYLCCFVWLRNLSRFSSCHLTLKLERARAQENCVVRRLLVLKDIFIPGKGVIRLMTGKLYSIPFRKKVYRGEVDVWHYSWNGEGRPKLLSHLVQHEITRSWKTYAFFPSELVVGDINCSNAKYWHHRRQSATSSHMKLVSVCFWSQPLKVFPEFVVFLGKIVTIVLVSGNNLENLLSCEITFNLLHLWGETFFLPLPHRSDPSCIFAMVRINPCICVIIMVCICMYMYSCVQNSVVTHSYIWSKNPYS